MVTDKEFPEYKNKLLKTLYVEGKPIHEGLPKKKQNLVIDPKLCTTHEYLKNPVLNFLFGRIYNWHHMRKDKKILIPYLRELEVSSGKTVIVPRLNIHRRPFQKKWTKWWNDLYNQFNKVQNEKLKNAKVPSHHSQQDQDKFRVLATVETEKIKQFDVNGFSVVANPNFKAPKEVSKK